MIKREWQPRKRREATAGQARGNEPSYGWPGEPRSKDRRRKSFWTSVALSTVMARML